MAQTQEHYEEFLTNRMVYAGIKGAKRYSTLINFMDLEIQALDNGDIEARCFYREAGNRLLAFSYDGRAAVILAKSPFTMGVDIYE